MIIGAGLAGLSIASVLHHSSEDFLIVEKSHSCGGQWRHHANFLSRVNSSEPSYRLPLPKREAGRTNHTHFYEIIDDMSRLVGHLGAERFHIHTAVRSVHPVSSAAHGPVHWVVAGAHVRLHHQDFQCCARVVALCTNRRLGAPRTLVLAGEGAFEGSIMRGIAGDFDSAVCANKTVSILGMGPFAIECMRTSFERGARHADILCRQRGCVSPQLFDWLRFIRPFDTTTLRTDAGGDSIIMSRWQSLYDDSGAARPECWLNGLLKPDGHTVSVSDIFFVAHTTSMLTTRVGEVDHLTEHALVTRDGQVSST